MQGNFLKVFNTYLVGINQVNGFKTHNELTIIRKKPHSIFASNFVKSGLLMYFYGKLWKIYKNNYDIECGFFLMHVPTG